MPKRFQKPNFSAPLSEIGSSLSNRVREKFNLREVRDWQSHALDRLVQGKDIMVRAGTGAGKSLVFQGMALSKPDAIVLVISPLISLMQDQVDECSKIGLRAVMLTRDTIRSNPVKIWRDVDKGEYQLVYASPEVLFQPSGHFQSNTLKTRNALMKNLALVAVDECHCIWCWERFRPEFRNIGQLRRIFINIPFACFSATLAPHVAAYIHAMCGLDYPTTLFSLSIRRDDINVLVVPFEGGDNIEPLLNLISGAKRDLLQIPKTMIFVDGVDRAARMAAELQQHVPGSLQGVPRDVLIRTYWASIDDDRKAETLKYFRCGRTRIVLCTDAFSLGVNIPDIDLVVQWGVNEKLTIESLWQRIGRGSRGPGRMSTCAIFVNKTILESVPRDWDNAWKPANCPVLEESEQSDLDEPWVIPVSKERPLAKFGIPVLPETLSRVCQHIRGLYREAASLQDAHKLARQESSGTQHDRMPMSQKIDPSVLWVLTTTGCRHRVFQMIFREPDNGIFLQSHCGMCCNNCAFARNVNPDTVVAMGVSLHSTVSYLRTDPSRNKIVLLQNIRTAALPNPNDHRRESVSVEQRKSLTGVLERWRITKLRQLDVPNAVPSIVLPNRLLSRIVTRVKHIVTFAQLLNALRDAKWDIKSSLLSEADLVIVFALIEKSLESTHAKERDKQKLPKVATSAPSEIHRNDGPQTHFVATSSEAPPTSNVGSATKQSTEDNRANKPLARKRKRVVSLDTTTSPDSQSTQSESPSRNQRRPKLKERHPMISAKDQPVRSRDGSLTIRDNEPPRKASKGPKRQTRSALQVLENIRNSRIGSSKRQVKIRSLD